MPINLWPQVTGWRRVALAIVLSLFCFFAVFALPSIFFNSVNAARQAQPAATSQTSPQQQSPATDQQQTNQPAPQSQTAAPPKTQSSVFERLRGIIGIIVILGIAFGFS